MTTLSRTIVLSSDNAAQSLWGLLKANWRAMAEAGKPLAVTIGEHKAKRNNEQNKLLHAVIRDIAASAWLNGRQYSAEVWKEHLKRDLLGTEEAILPSGEVVTMAISTASLNMAQFAEFIDRIHHYAATELGVEFTA